MSVETVSPNGLVVSKDPRQGLFESLVVHGGNSVGLAGPWRLEHYGYGMHAFVHQHSGDVVPFEAVILARRRRPEQAVPAQPS